MVTGENPYIGPRPFRKGDTLYGRDWETEELRDLLIARRFVLLHSPSGAGKTSLIQAGLIPALQADGFTVLPPIRVGMDPPPNVLAANCPFNRFVLSAHISLGDVVSEHEGHLPDLTELCESSLDQLFTRVMDTPEDEQADETRTVLIFDQFEEILTVDSLNLAAKVEFFEQLGEALKSRDRWALFALREDYVAGLESYLQQVPTRLSTHFQLEPLRKEAALEAIRRPAQTQGVNYAEGVAEALVDDLLTIPLGKSEFVEPVQLQVVCYDLWGQWQAHKSAQSSTITHEHLQAFGDVEQALSNFYDACIASATQQMGIRERDLRSWFSTQLITPADTRGIVYKGEHTTAGIPNSAISVLDRLHIIRVEPRAGADWVELTHDGFIEPIQDANQEWQELQWAIARRRLKRLVTTVGVMLGLIVLVLLSVAYISGQDAEQAEEGARQTAQAALGIEGTATAQVGILAKTEVAEQKLAERSATQNASTQQAVNLQATASARVAQSASFLAQAQADLEQDDTASALARVLQAYMINPDQSNIQSILASAAYAPGPRQVLATGIAETYYYSQIALSPDERSVVYARGLPPSTEIQQRTLTESDYALEVWDVETGSVQRLLAHHTAPVVDVAYAQGAVHDRILSASAEELVLWDALTGDVLWTTSLAFQPELAEARLTSVALADDGSAALAGGCMSYYVNNDCKAGVVVWIDLVDMGTMRVMNTSVQASVTAVSFTADPQVVIGATSSGVLARCLPFARGEFCTEIPVAPATPTQTSAEAQRSANGISALAVNRVTDMVLIGLQDGTVLVGNLRTVRITQRFAAAHAGVVRGVDFGPDGTTALSVGEDGVLILWDLTTGAALRHFTFNDQGMWDVVYRQIGTTAITALSDDSLVLWDLQPGDQQRVIDAFSSITALALDTIQHRILTGANTGQVVVWSASGIASDQFSAGQAAVDALAVSQSGDPFVVTLANRNTLLRWDGRTSRAIPSSLTDFSALDLSPDGMQLLIVGCSHKLLLSPNCQTGGLELIAMGDSLADDMVLRYTVRPSDNDPGLNDHLRGVSSVAFSPDGESALTAAKNGSIYQWDIVNGTGQPLAAAGEYVEAINHVVIEDVGKTQYALMGGCLARDAQTQTCSQGTVLLWDLGTNQLVSQFSTRNVEITRVAFHPDGQSILTGASDGVISRWDRATSALILRYQGHTGAITGLAFSTSAISEHQWFISSGRDARLIRWRLDTLDELLNWAVCNRYIPGFTENEGQLAALDVDLTCVTDNQPLTFMVESTPPPLAAMEEPTPEAVGGSEATPEPQAEVFSTPAPQPTEAIVPLSLGETRTARDSVVAQYWSFDGTQGDLISLALTSPAAYIEGSLMLYDPAGRELVTVSQAGASVLLSSFVLPQTGRYTVVTQQFNAVGAEPYSVTLSNLKITTATPYSAAQFADIQQMTR